MDERNTFGIDMGDRKHSICKLNAEGEVIALTSVMNTKPALGKFFKNEPPSLIAMEAGTHSAWVSDFLSALGHEVLVGNPRRLRAIWSADQKTDERDAQMLARIARVDKNLLYPITHRCREAQLDHAHLKARDLLVKTRKMQVSHVRSAVKTFGERVSKCSTESFVTHARKDLSDELLTIFESILDSILDLSARIKEYDKKIDQLCKEKYPETKILQQVSGVGPITALSYLLVIEDPKRFKKSRDIGPFLGLCPKRDQSGDTDKQLHITKAGNSALRSLLVSASQYILGNFGPDSDLRAFGLKIAERGGKNAKRRAVVAVARKLAILLHRLWVDEATYVPHYKEKKKEHSKAA